MGLGGEVAIVSGASRGFGRAIAQALAARGIAVTLTARSDERLAEVVRSIEGAGGRALAVAADVCDKGDVERVVRASEERFGRASVLVHAAGCTGPFGPIHLVDPDEWWQAQEVHVRGAVLLARAVVPSMIERGGGRVIVVASAAGRHPVPNISGYAVSKATQMFVVEHLALEGKADGVIAFSIQPGTVITDLADGTLASPEAQKWAPKFVDYLRRVKATEDPALGLKRCSDFCLELISGRCDALTGRYLTPDDDLAALVRAQESGERTVAEAAGDPVSPPSGGSDH